MNDSIIPVLEMFKAAYGEQALLDIVKQAAAEVAEEMKEKTAGEDCTCGECESCKARKAKEVDKK